MIHTAQDFHKKPDPKSKIESPQDKLKKEMDRKKVRDDAMKQWRQKWADREPINQGNLVQIIGAAQEKIAKDSTPDKKTGSRNLEMVGSKKQIAQTAQNWNPKTSQQQQDENEIKLVTPTKQQ